MTKLTRSISEGKRFDLTKESPQQLLAHLSDKNKWFRQAARREIMIRGGIPVTGEIGLEQLWALNANSPVTDGTQQKMLNDGNPYFRLWVVRLACDDGVVSDHLAELLADLAYREPNLEVRSQLACSARRLPAAQALPAGNPRV